MAFSGNKALLIATLLVVQTGCSTLPPRAQRYDSFAEYAESVFRHQNELTSRLIMMDEDGALGDNARLQNAEQEMNDACYLLNEYAEHEMAGESMGLFFKRQVQASIEKCDRKIQKLETLLPKTPP